MNTQKKEPSEGLEYFVTWRVMWKRLGLTKSGPMRDIYAVIYGFSQDGVSAFESTEKSFMDITGASESTVRRCIGALVEAGLILKTQIGSGPHSYVEYRANLQKVEECKMGVNLTPIKMGFKNNKNGVQKQQKWGSILPPNNNIYIYKNILLAPMRAREEEKFIKIFFFWKDARAPGVEADGFFRQLRLDDWKAQGKALDTPEKLLAWADGWKIGQGVVGRDAAMLAGLNCIYGALLGIGREDVAGEFINDRLGGQFNENDGKLYLSVPASFITLFNETIWPAISGKLERPAGYDAIAASLRSISKGKDISFIPFGK